MFDSILQDPIIEKILFLIIGAVVTIIIGKLREKTASFYYTPQTTRIGITADDEIYGSMRVFWRDQEMNNLHLSSIEVENRSFRDFENVKFKVYCEKETEMLTERTGIVDTPYVADHSDDFKDRVKQASAPDSEQSVMDILAHQREYNIPVFNRGQKVIFQYLCTRPNDQESAHIFVDCNTKGVRMKKAKVPSVLVTDLFGTPIYIALVRGLIIVVVVYILCGLLIENVWVSSAIAMLSGLMAQLFGAVWYRAERAVLHAIAG